MSTLREPIEYLLTKLECSYVDQGGCSWPSVESWFFLDILGGCGCGSSDEFGVIGIELLRYFGRDLDATTNNPFSAESTYYTYELMAHWMDSVGLIEHGTMITGSWLTDKGKQILNVINAAN